MKFMRLIEGGVQVRKTLMKMNSLSVILIVFVKEYKMKIRGTVGKFKEKV